jgi:hypothetical protein
MTDAGIGVDLGWLNLSLPDVLVTVEHNTISATQEAVHVMNDGSSLIYDNNFSAGDSTTSIGLDYTGTSPEITSLGNLLNGFAAANMYVTAS